MKGRKKCFSELSMNEVLFIRKSIVLIFRKALNLKMFAKINHRYLIKKSVALIANLQVSYKSR